MQSLLANSAVAFTLLCGSTFVGLSSPAAATLAAPQPVLWQDPGEVASKDLFWGPGAADRAPRSPFTFVKEDLSGTKPKVHVKDAQGVTWSVKFDRRSVQRGREVPTEIAASRLMWAAGYLVEESYLVENGVIEKVGSLKRAKSAIGTDGRFKVARFERRAPDVERLSTEWSVDDSPFVGSKELSGLIIMCALLNNWDFRPGNTGVLRLKAGDAQQDWYLVTDLGTAFGGMGYGASRTSKWNVNHYRNDRQFIYRADDEFLELHFQADGTNRARLPIEHARWLAGITSQLTEPQVRRAFEAAGASEEEVQGFTIRFLEKVRELATAADLAQPAAR